MKVLFCFKCHHFLEDDDYVGSFGTAVGWWSTVFLDAVMTDASGGLNVYDYIVTIFDDDDSADKLGTAVGWGKTGFVNTVMTAALSILKEGE